MKSRKATLSTVLCVGAVGAASAAAKVTLEVPTNYATAKGDVPPPNSVEEGFPYSDVDTQETTVVPNSAGYWPCIRVPKGLDERYPTMKTGGWFNSNKFCDFSKQPGHSMYSCRGMYPLYKFKNFPVFGKPHCFNETLGTKLTKEVVAQLDKPQNSGDLCTNYIGKGWLVTPPEVYAGVSDEWIATRKTLGCPDDVWSVSEGAGHVFCNQVTGIDMMQTCGYAKDATKRDVLHACWDVCADTLNRCSLTKKFGMGTLMSSQNYDLKENMEAMTGYETVDNWCLFLSQDQVCLPMKHYYPDGKTTMNSCYPDGANSNDAAEGLPADHAFAGTKGNFFRKDGKKTAEIDTTPAAKTPAGGDASPAMGRTFVAGIIGTALAFLM